MRRHRFRNLERTGRLLLGDPPAEKQGRGFSVAEDFGCRFEIADLGRLEVRVPAGSFTDLESIPFGLRNLFDRLGPGKRAGVEHDHLYRDGHWVLNGHPVRASRAAVDAFYRWRQIEDGVPPWRATLKWAGLTALGWPTWRRYRKTEHLTSDT